MNLRSVLLPTLVLLVAATARAHTGHAPTAPQADAPAAPAARAAPGGTRDPQAYFTDTELVTQDGRKLRFYSDVLAGRTVVVNIVYTHCNDACPLITQKLLEVRQRLGERFGSEVVFLTLTSDPERDTPAVLKRFAREQGADVPGWLFLTGSKDNVGLVLRRLGSSSANVEEHPTLIFAGNVPAKRWTKIRPDAPGQLIAERIRLLADATAELAGSH